MNRFLSKLARVGIAFVAALTLTLMSTLIERTGPELVSYSNLCPDPKLPPCAKPALKAGFPIPYLFDAPGVSRERQLAFGEDKVHMASFAADIIFYFVITLLIGWRALRRRGASARNTG